jgi:DNA recombination protein Rad52
MSRTIGQIREDLNAKIPRGAITTRESGFGSKLSYLTSYYVFDRLNQIFGPENWSYTIQELKNTFSGEVKGKHYVCYVAQVALQTKYPDGSVRHDVDVGFGDGQDATNPGKPHELASKEAVTDGLKRCAKSLGMSMGLALYDKGQDNVEEETAKGNANNAAPNTNRAPNLPAANGPKPASAEDNKVPAGASAGARGGKADTAGAKPATSKAEDAKALRTLIISAASVLEAKNIIDKGGAVNEEEMAKLFEAARYDEVNGIRDYAILTVLGYTGLRLSELCNLNVEEIGRASCRERV